VSDLQGPVDGISNVIMSCVLNRHAYGHRDLEFLALRLFIDDIKSSLSGRRRSTYSESRRADFDFFPQQTPRRLVYKCERLA